MGIQSLIIVQAGFEETSKKWTIYSVVKYLQNQSTDNQPTELI